MTMITPNAIDDALNACVYARDERKAPDAHRRSKFLVGWEDATQHQKIYTDEALERLTWKNLGYRLGQHFGAQTAAEIDAVFDYLTEVWNRTATA
ncbi:hypothetical protein SAMN05421644_1194 [Allochromatium warmingii]|uniref:Uncharacterized protein n=1 Tax=Allochromatium warmingii TaxID=61595 RepID=A0A1H3FK08_ALLWA|nr:hypothetical protein [Allochromatium warmingii]SDX90718.1 hypothetical protein SAMN05421644_1194 [Allochromatium warmingii]